MGRAPCCDKDSVKRGPWSPEEDVKLKSYMDQHGSGGNWIALPQKIGLRRCGKSCRLRWLNYLRPNIKHGGFSEEEDNIICSLYISIGSRWSIIAAQLPGRTDNDIKNYWNTRLKKKILGGRRKQSSNSKTHEPNDSNGGDDSQLSNSALERLQLHMQLQNPNFSFYNNPSFLPKLHPLQEKIIHQSLNPSPNCLMQNSQPSPNFYEQIQSPKFAELVSSSTINYTTTNTSLVESTIMTTTEGESVGQQDSSFQAEIENFLDDKKVSSMPHQDQITGFDWWFNEFDGMKATTTSSNCWNTNSEVYDPLSY
ncbi:hypothetical protein ACFE04_010200 [Oxalis oulophora]